MFNNYQIRTKILFAFIAITFFAVAVSGYIAFITGEAALRDESFNKLTAIREMKATQIESFFELINDQVVTFSEDRMVIDAMRLFDKGVHAIESDLAYSEVQMNTLYQELRIYYDKEFITELSTYSGKGVSTSDYYPDDSKAALLQHLYIASNESAIGEKYLLNDAGDGSQYSATHAAYHPILRNYLETFGFYDLFLVDVETGGHIVYSVFKEMDFGTSLTTGPYKDTHFAKVYQAAAEATEKDFVALVDFNPYDPSYGQEAAFIASPIFDGDEKVGVLIFQMPIDEINRIMTNDYAWSDVGLGQSGETYLVGEDYTLRNQSRFLLEDRENFIELITRIGLPKTIIEKINQFDSTIGLLEVRTSGTESALEGNTGTEIFDDYRGVSVLSAFKPLEISGLNWVIISEIDENEAFSYIKELGYKIIYGATLLFLFIVLIGIYFAKMFTDPIRQLTQSSIALANGNLDVSISHKSGDEIGVLAKSFDQMRQSIKKLIDELEAANQFLESKVKERTAELESASIRFKSIVENASDAIITIDSDQKIVLFNPEAEKIFGYTEDEVSGKPLTLLMPENSAKKHPHEVEKFRNENVDARHHSRSMDTRRSIVGRRKDGTIFPGEAGISRMNIEDQQFFTAFFRDITDRRALEKQIQEQLKTIKKQRDRMSVELNFAREIQMDMLPLIFPAFPKRSELDLHAVLHPAREVGGDFYDFFFIDEDHLCLVIADVSGKGAPGALLMAVTKTLIKSRAADDNITSSIITHVNNELSRDNKSAMFVTAFLCILDVRTGEVQYTNAGHNPPYVKRVQGDKEVLDEFHGPVIGAMSGFTYGQDTIQLGLDDILIMFTDGVTEAMNDKEALYTDKRLEKIISDSTVVAPESLINEIVEDVANFQGDAEQADDITILALKFKGESQYSEKRILIANQMENLEIVDSQFSEFAQENSIPDDIRQKVSIVLDDLLNNIVSYAYTDDEEHEIEVLIEYSGNRLVITLKDDGLPFNPFSTPPPEISSSIEERSVGGLGIFITRTVMDEFLYQRLVNKNVVTLVKMVHKTSQ